MICREKLIQQYNEEFLSTLIHQATDDKCRYAPKNHFSLKVGDVVLLVEKHQKPSSYPLAIVRQIFQNTLGEITEVKAFKGSTKELVRRHVTSLIPYLTHKDSDMSENAQTIESDDSDDENLDGNSRPARKAAQVAQDNRHNFH